jgi:hypothetical protein
MTFTYISTCSGGNHHTFRDETSRKLVIFETEEIRDRRIGKDTAVVNYAELEAALPAPLKTEVDRPKPVDTQPIEETPAMETKK